MVQKQKQGKAALKTRAVDEDESNSVAYCQGWSVILKNRTKCLLWNASSGKKIQLPRIKNFPSSYSKCILSSSPAHEQCTVVFLSDKITPILYCKLGDREWTKLKYSEEEDDICYDDAIVFNKKLYAIDLYGLMDEIVIEKKKVRFEPNTFRMPIYPPKAEKMRFVESNKELFVVMILSHSRRLEVFKLDFSLDECVPVDRLGDQVFYLSNRYSGSFSGEQIGIKGNRIYLTEGNNKSLYVFDLEDANISLTANQPDSSTLWFSLKGMMPELWITNNPTDREQEIVEEEAVSDSEEKSVEGNKSVDTQETGLGKLPMHLQQTIAQYLSQASDYMNFRAVSRTLRSLAPPCRWRCASTDCSKTNIEYPWLMSLSKKDGSCNFYDPRDNVTYSMYSPELSTCEILFSKEGWLLLSQGPRSMCLYEPFAKRRIELPELRKNYRFNGVCFSGSPTASSRPTIIGISHIFFEHVRICCLDPRNQVWTEFTFNNHIAFNPSWNNPVFLNESFYFLGNDGRLGIFEVREGMEPTWRICINPGPIWSQSSTMCRNFLMDFEDELFSVFVGGEAGELVKVFRLDLLRGNWVQVKSLGNQILFISEATSLAIEANEERMKNKIYFSNFSNINNHHVFYSLKTQKYYTSGGGENQRLYDTIERMHKTWIQPKLVPTIQWPYEA